MYCTPVRVCRVALLERSTDLHDVGLAEVVSTLEV